MAKLIIDDTNLYKDIIIYTRCSHCQKIIAKSINQEFKYCPNCGTVITCIGENGNVNRKVKYKNN